jgi:hypothetical protein
MEDGTSTTIHANRLKRAHGPIREKVTSFNRVVNEETKRKCRGANDPRDSDEEGREANTRTASHQTRRDAESNDSESDESGSDVNSNTRGRVEYPEWAPGSTYLQRKLNTHPVDDVTYSLRSRLVNRSEQETETDKGRATASHSQEIRHAMAETQESASPGRTRDTMGHSYNLRSK